jgi:hypothetical protein
MARTSSYTIKINADGKEAIKVFGDIVDGLVDVEKIQKTVNTATTKLSDSVKAMAGQFGKGAKSLEGFAKSVKDTASRVKEFAGRGIDRMKSGLSSLGPVVAKIRDQFKKFGSGLMTLAKGPMVAFTVVSAAIVAGLAVMAAGFQKAREITDIANIFGITTQEAQKLDIALKASGNTIDQVSGVVNSLAANLTAAKNGSEEARKKFEDLGLAVEQFDGKTPIEQLDLIGEAVRNLGGSFERQRGAFLGLVGEQGAQLLPLFRLAKETRDFFEESYEAFGGILSDDEINRLTEANRLIDLIQTSWTAVTQQFAVGISDEFIKFGETFVQGLADLLNDGQTIANLSKEIVSTFTLLFGDGSTIAEGIVESIRTTLRLIEGVAAGIRIIYATIKKIYEDNEGNIAETIEDVSKLPKVQEAFKTLGEIIGNAAAAVIKAAFTIPPGSDIGPRFGLRQDFAPTGSSLLNSQPTTTNLNVRARVEPSEAELENTRLQRELVDDQRDTYEEIKDIIRGIREEEKISVSEARKLLDITGQEAKVEKLKLDLKAEQAIQAGDLLKLEELRAGRMEEQALYESGSADFDIDKLVSLDSEITKLEAITGLRQQSITSREIALRLAEKGLSISETELSNVQNRNEEEVKAERTRAADEAARKRISDIQAAYVEKTNAAKVAEDLISVSLDEQIARAQNLINQGLTQEQIQKQLLMDQLYKNELAKVEELIKEGIADADAKRIAFAETEVQLGKQRNAERQKELDLILSGTKDVGKSVLGLGKLGEDLFRSIGNSIEAVADGTLEIGDVLKSALLRFGKDATGRFLDQYLKVETFTEMKLGTIADKVGGFFESVGNGFNKVVDGIKAVSKEGGLSLSRIGSSLMSGVKGLFGGAEEGTSFVDTIMGGFSSIMDMSLGSIMDIGMMLFNIGSMLADMISSLHEPTRGTVLREQIAEQEMEDEQFQRLGVKFNPHRAGEIAAGRYMAAFDEGFSKEIVRRGTPKYKGVGYTKNIPIGTGRTTAVEVGEQRGFTRSGELYGATAAISPFIYEFDPGKQGDMYLVGESAGVLWTDGFSKAVKDGQDPERLGVEAMKLAKSKAEEAGITLADVLSGLNDQFESYLDYVEASDARNKGNMDEIMRIGGEEFGARTAGVLSLFGDEGGAGFQPALAVLKSFTTTINGEVVPAIQGLTPEFEAAFIAGTATFEQLKGVFGNILTDEDIQYILDNGITTFEGLSKIFAKQFEAGFKLDPETIRKKIEAMLESVEAIGPAFLQSIQVGASEVQTLVNLLDAVKESALAAFGEEFTNSILEATNIAGAFADTFEIIRDLQSYMAEGGGGLDAFSADLQTALAAGRANIEQYGPQIREAVKAARELREMIEEALAPTPVEAFFLAIEKKIEQLKSQLETALTNSFVDAIENASSAEEAATLFADNFAGYLEEQVFNAIVNGVMHAALTGAALAPMIAQLEAMTAAFLEDGVLSEEELAQLQALVEAIYAEGRRVSSQTAPIAGTVYGAGYGDRNVESEEEREQRLFQEERKREREERRQERREAREDYVSIIEAFADALEAKLISVTDNLKLQLREVFLDPTLGSEEFGKRAGQTLKEYVANGLVDAFIETVVFQAALAPALKIWEDVFLRIASGQVKTADEWAQAQADILEGFALVNKLFDDPEFKKAFDLWRQNLNDYTKDLRSTSDSINSSTASLNANSEAINNSVDALTGLTSALIEETFALGSLFLNIGGGAGLASLKLFVPMQTLEYRKQQEANAAWEEFWNAYQQDPNNANYLGHYNKGAARRAFYEQYPEYRDVAVGGGTYVDYGGGGYRTSSSAGGAQVASSPYSGMVTRSEADNIAASARQAPIHVTVTMDKKGFALAQGWTQRIEDKAKR